jgi:pimeloyl-ACP methyl ester carboxylesterase
MPTVALQNVQIEYQWVGLNRHAHPQAPLLIFLHEGLGSVAMWKDFPEKLCAAGGFSGLVYSRYGYGHSTPRPASEAWSPLHLQTQANQLSELLAALGINPEQTEPWLFGHSDGGSIALLYAAQNAATTAGIVVLAPHRMVEPVCISAITSAAQAYRSTPLREKLSRFHADADSAFGGWSGMWLNPEFASWNMQDIQAALHHIVCPVLAIQGEEDAYGTMAQIDGIKQVISHTQVLKIPDCGHSPHRDAELLVITQVTQWINSFSGFSVAD